MNDILSRQEDLGMQAVDERHHTRAGGVGEEGHSLQYFAVCVGVCL